MRTVTLAFLLACAAWSSASAADKVSARSPKLPANDFGVSYLPGWQGEKLWANLRDLGVGWVRLDLWIGHPEYEARFAERLRRSLDEGYALWLTIMHRDRSNVADPRRFDQTKRGGFPPEDPQKYQALVVRAVKPLADRLRSQGKAPGDWLVVQIENEVAPNDVLPPNPRRFWHGSSEEYLRTLELAHAAVKSVDPAIPVAVGGIASEALESFLRKESPGSAWIERLLKEGRFDWADVHLYHAIDDIPGKIAWVRGRWTGALAATEVGGPDERARTPYSEEAHAVDLPRRFAAAQKAGIRRIFWLAIADSPTADRLGQTIGLTTADGSRKPAFDAYRSLIKKSRAARAE